MKSPAFQFYPTDYLGSQRVQMMTLEEEGAYCRLLWSCWQHGSIPADPELAARLVGKGCSTTVARMVLPMFEIACGEGRLTHDRLERERVKQADWREKSAAGGKKSAEMRQKSKGGSSTVETVVQAPCQPNGNTLTPSPSPSPISVSDSDSFQPEIPTTGQAPNDAQRKKALRRENAKMLLDFLNEFAGRSFRATDTNLDLIAARLSEPDVTPEGCEAMIERQVALWKGTETEEYLQPSTLFGKQKFGGYYDKRELPVKTAPPPTCL